MAKKSNPNQVRDTFVAKKLAKMSLAEKIGQLLTFTRRGAMITPSAVEQITKLECGGLCLEPYAVETCQVSGRSPVAVATFDTALHAEI